MAHTHHGPDFPVPDQGEITWTDAEAADIETVCARYPERRAALLPVLWKAQRKWGWLSVPVLRKVAETIGLPASEVLAVASFYSMLKKQPTGRYLIQVCHTLSCAQRGADGIVDHLKSRLGISEGQTTPDGLFTLQRVECLASCGSAPMCQVNDDFHEFLTPDRVDELLAALRAGTPPSTPRPEVDQWHWTVPS
jgi:NADH-quinone oxidoreductase subunit E